MKSIVGTMSGVSTMEEAARLYPAPGNKRAYLQQPCDHRIVAARPDLKFQLHHALVARYKTGFGFVLMVAGKPVPFDFEQVDQKFEAGAFPLLNQHVTQGGYRFALESFTTQDAKGRGVVMLRLTAWRQGNEPAAVELGFLVTRAPSGSYSSHPNEDYIPFESWGAAWEQKAPCEAQGNVLSDGTHVVAQCRYSHGVQVTPERRMDSVVWNFRVESRREAPETIEVLIPYEGLSQTAADDDNGLDFRAEQAFPLDQQQELAALSFEAELTRQRLNWARQLGRAARIHVPDPLVQTVYKTLTLNTLQFLGGSSGTTACRPGQGGFNDFSAVYAWEASHYLIQMARQGFHAEVCRVLDYLLTTQGVKGPEGDFTDIKGCFRPEIHWVNETGAVLQIFAEYAFASGDFDRLKKDAAALVEAARWIQRQRNNTREVLPTGTKALHYGLLPKGRPHDWPISGHFLFSNTYTWSGLNRLAQAFEVAGLPEAGWLRQEADEFRVCILAAVRGSLKPHPCDPALLWVPSDIYEDPAEAIKTTIFCGPMSLIGSGILDPDDPLIGQIEACLRAAKCMNDQFAFRMRMMEAKELADLQHIAAGGHVDLYYVTFGEVPWHRVWLEGGQREKAQRFFNMTLAYSVSRDLHLAQERFCPQLPWLLPWQPNGSGNGRIISMILANLCYVRGNVCHVLQGVPDAWFTLREPLGVDGLWISGTRVSFRLEPKGTGNGWLFTYRCDGSWVPEKFVVALPGAIGARCQIEILTDGQVFGSKEV